MTTMRKMFNKLFKRFRRNHDKVSKASSTSQVTHLRTSLKDHLAATTIQLAFRRYKAAEKLRITAPELCKLQIADGIIPERYNTKVRDSCGIKAGSMPEECNKQNTPVKLMAVSIMPTTSVSSTSSENLKSSDIHSAHQGHSPGRHAPILRHFTLGRLLRVHATMLRYLRSMIRINPPQKELHLEPKSRNRTLQHVSILDCYGLCFSTPHFTSSESSAEDPDLVPVYLNVYDITPVNACLYWLGLGVHHSGVQVYGVEYSFGIDEEGEPQVFKMEPRNCEGLEFRKGILVGFSRLRANEVEDVISELAEEFRRKDYYLVTNNCNHFSTQACLRLTGNSIPPWVNRLARIGTLFVRSGSWCRNKILACNCKGKDAASKKEKHESSSSSFSFSSVSSEVSVVGNLDILEF